jgi:hypothetical protein
LYSTGGAACTPPVEFSGAEVGLVPTTAFTAFDASGDSTIAEASCFDKFSFCSLCLDCCELTFGNFF